MEINEQKKQEILQKLLENKRAFEEKEKQRLKNNVLEFQQFVQSEIPKKKATLYPQRNLFFAIPIFLILFLSMGGWFWWLYTDKEAELAKKNQLLENADAQMMKLGVKMDSLLKEVNFLLAETKEARLSQEHLKELKEELEIQNKVFHGQQPFHLSQSQKVAYYEKKLEAYQELLLRKDELLRQYERYYSEK